MHARPDALLFRCHLHDASAAVFQAEVTASQRTMRKKHGTVQNMRITEKGKVENKTDQLLMLVTTTTQDAKEAPYALQAAKLTWSELRPDLVAAVKKGLVNKPSLMQLASKPCSLVWTSVVSFCVLCLQGKSRASTASG